MCQRAIRHHTPAGAGRYYPTVFLLTLYAIESRGDTAPPGEYALMLRSCVICCHFIYLENSTRSIITKQALQAHPANSTGANRSPTKQTFSYLA